ncbi:sensor histidine kinase [Sphingomonas sp. MMS24-JH45]
MALIDVEAEERAAQDRAADKMIDILGHEFFNGLSPIVSLADSAVTAARAGHPALPDILATLARRVEGLESFTRGYRTLAPMPIPSWPPCRWPLAADLARLFEARFGSGAILTCDIAAPGAIDADGDQLTQAIWALLQNAAEAAGTDGRIGLAIGVGRTGLTVRVSDSGPGVAVDARAHLPAPFHTTKPNGSGIGLALARRIARNHGGDVTLDEGRKRPFGWSCRHADAGRPHPARRTP